MIIVAVGGCSTPPPAPTSTAPTPARSAAMMVDGAVVAWEALRPAFAEVAGAAIMREAALDVLIDKELGRRAITITPQLVEAEESLIRSSLAPDENHAARLLDELRDRDGLGPSRWQALLERNASLRALVRDAVRISPEMISVAFDVAHGSRRQVRLVIVRTLGEAESIASRRSRGEAFADLAVERSIDSSAARGGLLPPLARSDPSIPLAIREAIWSTPIGSTSPPIVVESGFALVEPVKELPADAVKLDDVHADIEHAVRLSQERILMDQLAARLLREAKITVIDDDLHAAWRRQK